jgi:hypothetical protein
MATSVRARASKFFRNTTEILISFHMLIGVLLLIALGLIEAWHVIRMVTR